LLWRLLLAVTLCGGVTAASANECQAIKDTQKRLACYDQANRAATTPPACSKFEQQSNELLDRVEIGFPSPDPMQALVGELNATFSACIRAKPQAEKAASYAAAMNLWKTSLTHYKDGVLMCDRVNRDFPPRWPNPPLCEEWGKAVIPGDARRATYGSAFNAAVNALPRFE
jgi:hypothetical protein